MQLQCWTSQTHQLFSRSFGIGISSPTFLQSQLQQQDTHPSAMQESENPLWAENAGLPHHPPDQQHPFRADDTPECPEISPFALVVDPFDSSRHGNLATATKGAVSSRHLAITRRVASAGGGRTITAKGFYKEGAPKKAFTTGVLGCMSNCSLCCVGICCLSCLYGDNYSRVSKGFTSGQTGALAVFSFGSHSGFSGSI